VRVAGVRELRVTGYGIASCGALPSLGGDAGSELRGFHGFKTRNPQPVTRNS